MNLFNIYELSFYGKQKYGYDISRRIRDKKKAFLKKQNFTLLSIYVASTFF